MGLDWTNKIDGVDDVMADDVNSLANAIIENEGELENKADKANTYTKTETDTALGDLANLTFIDEVEYASNDTPNWNFDELQIGAYKLKDTYYGLKSGILLIGVGAQTIVTGEDIKRRFHMVYTGGGSGWSDWFNVLDKSDIVDDVESEKSKKVLSAKQGKLLNDAITAKADKVSTYTKTESDNLLTAKADKSDTYTKAQALSMFAPNTTTSGTSVNLTDHLRDVDFINYTLYGSAEGVGELDSVTGKYKLGLEMLGKNLFNITAMYGAEFSAGAKRKSTYDNLIKSFSTNAFTVNPTGKTYAGGVSSAVPVPTGAGYNYCLSFKYSSSLDMGASSNYNYIIIVQFYDANMAMTGYQTLNSQCVGGVCEHRTATAPVAWSTAKYFAVAVLTRDTVLNGDIVLSDIQFEKSTAKTTFEAYKSAKAEWYQDTPLYEGDYAGYASQTIVQSGVSQSAVLPALHTIDADGTVSATTQAQPDNIIVKYYQDINKVIQNLKNAVIALGGVL